MSVQLLQSLIFVHTHHHQVILVNVCKWVIFMTEVRQLMLRNPVTTFSMRSCLVPMLSVPYMSCHSSMFLIQHIRGAPWYLVLSTAPSSVDNDSTSAVTVQIRRSPSIGGRLWWDENFNTRPSTSPKSTSFKSRNKTFGRQQQIEQKARRWQLVWKLWRESTHTNIIYLV